MEKQAFLDRLQELISQEDILSVSHDVNELKSQFQDFLTEEERKRQIAFIENESEEESELLVDEIKDEFFKLYQEYRAKKVALVSAQKLEEEANLRLKKKLIERLKTLIVEEENIGVAIATYKEIHDEWKKTGDIPRDKRQEIQNEFSKLLESFFFNLKIYRELKEHDLKRNSQLKRELVDKIKALLETESIKEVESSIKALQNEFDEIGPVVHEEWEEIKRDYWDAVKAVYAKIHSFYESKREQLHLNIEKKQALLEDVKAFLATINSIDNIKSWEEKTQEILSFQNQWKEIGFGNKKENEELWLQFRELCNAFFDKKRLFFEGLKQIHITVSKEKKQLIAKAEQLKSSTDWKDATHAFLKLQQEWKKLGSAGQKEEQRLWKEFRQVCDYFFNAKQKHFEDAEKEYVINLQKKLDLISEIEQYQADQDQQKTLTALKEFSTRFNSIGKVPLKKKDEVYKAYKEAIEKQYSGLKLDGTEKEKVFFQAKVATLKANPNAVKLIEKERKEIQREIANLKHEIIQFENNLGFFASSKGADVLKREVESKIDRAKRKIDEYQNKLKALVHE